MPLNVLVVSKGHPHDYSAFHAMLDADQGLTTTIVEQPAAQVVLRPESARDYDAVLFYDMWGVTRVPGDPAGVPSDDYRKSIESLLERGTGMVLLNHALVEWPDWPLWRQIHGSSFMLRAGVLDGKAVPGSGYRGGGGEPQRNATHFLSVVDPEHPVTRGIGNGFEVVDELYLKTAEFEQNPDIVPLLRSDYAFVRENFNPPPFESPEEKARWQHPPGSNLIVWAKRIRNSPVVAMDGGDGPAAYANPAFRQLLGNALRWVASDEARAWAGHR
jgi:hypothetical protein